MLDSHTRRSARNRRSIPLLVERLDERQRGVLRRLAEGGASLEELDSVPTLELRLALARLAELDLVYVALGESTWRLRPDGREALRWLW